MAEWRWWWCVEVGWVGLWEGRAEAGLMCGCAGDDVLWWCKGGVEAWSTGVGGGVWRWVGGPVGMGDMA